MADERYVEPISKKSSRDRELLKIIVLGAANVGKTTMMKRYVTDKFIADRRPTVGADFMTKKLKVEGTDVVLQLWDTAGQVSYSFGVFLSWRYPFSFELV